MIQRKESPDVEVSQCVVCDCVLFVYYLCVCVSVCFSCIYIIYYIYFFVCDVVINGFSVGVCEEVVFFSQ
jgi:hypothetical protein